MVLQLVLAAGLEGTGNHHLPLCSGSDSGAEGPDIHGPPGTDSLARSSCSIQFLPLLELQQVCAPRG